MAFIHEHRECLTGVQERDPWSPETDLQVDFVMVYGTDGDMPARVRAFREKGYTVHLMTGCAWGIYQDYVNGEWNGVSHRDESQTDRSGQPIMHGVDSPYLCPGPDFSRYLLEKLKPAVDAGVEAVHLEEPEFWDAGGYGEAFRREYRAYYGEDWRPPHESCDSRYRASALKVYLYRRLIAEVSKGLKDYARSLGRTLEVCIPTHSLVNYTQWKILSPEGTLRDIPTLDGCIAQVWTGTSRVGNVYRGRYDERTFETAFLEYGIAKELTRGTERKLWFLHDPVEDNPAYTWEDFRKNYLDTVAASLLHPDVFHYEVAPWPNRIFHGVYPKTGRLGWNGYQPDRDMKGAKPIPRDYAELICLLAQTLGDMEQADCGFEPAAPRVGLLMADSGLYQRTFPDCVPHSDAGVEGLNSRFVALLERQRAGEDTGEDSRRLMAEIAEDPALYNDYVASGPFPHFFGLAMPLVKMGLPLQPVQMENLPRFREATAAFDALILSEEWMKPRDPAEHEALADWVRQGGTLLLVGDGSDPYHAVRGWWNSEGRDYARPDQHLCERLGLGRDPAEGCYPASRGRVAVRRISPARLTLSPEAAEGWQQWVMQTAAPDFRPRNYFLLKRGPYRVAAVMKEGADAQPLVLRGCFVDLFSGSDDPVAEKTVAPGETALLLDLAALPGEDPRPVVSTARIECLEETEEGFRVVCKAAAGIRVRMRLKLPRRVDRAEAADETGEKLPVERCAWDEKTGTLSLCLPSVNRRTEILLH